MGFHAGVIGFGVCFIWTVGVGVKASDCTGPMVDALQCGSVSAWP